MEITVKVAENRVYDISAYRRYEGHWRASLYHLNATIDVRRNYDEDEKPTGWEASADRASLRRVPNLTGVVGTGRTMAAALLPFVKLLDVKLQTAHVQERFYREQQEVIDEICSCFTSDKAQALLQEAQRRLVLDWVWSENFGGALYDAAGRELAKVAVNSGRTGKRPFVVVWRAYYRQSDSVYNSTDGFKVGEVTGADGPDEKRRRLVRECRELAEAWLRKKGVLG